MLIQMPVGINKMLYFKYLIMNVDYLFFHFSPEWKFEEAFNPKWFQEIIANFRKSSVNHYRLQMIFQFLNIAF